MSCVRESSPQSEHVVNQRSEPKVRRFNPLRRLRQIFKRKAHSPEPNEVKSCDNIVEPPSLDTSRSRSTSQLIDEPFTRRRSLHSTILSVSHDSVFNPEQHSGQSDSESAVSVPRLGFPQANIQAELLEAVRRRRKIQDDDDSFDNEDLGLPRSPSMHSPTIATGNDLRLSKELITKSSHSTCSDGSLLSMGSSEMDEDSFGAHNSRHSSKISLHDKRTSQTYLDSSDGDYSTSVPLSHDVAKHRMAIRPKRKHGNPRSKKPLTVTNALPATPEVNEEHSGRSTSPETKPQTADTADGTTTISTVTSNTKTTTTTTTTTTTSSTTTTTNDTVIATEMPDVVTDTARVATPSTAGSCDLDTSVDEISVENVPRREEGFFHRLLSRRSTKKKASAAAKSASTEDVDVDRFLFDETTGARPRQREEPPPAGRMQLSYPPDMPPDHRPQQHRVPMPSAVAHAEDVFEPDTFAPIKQSFSLGQQHSHHMATTDDEATSSGDGSSVQKSSSSDSVSSAALDESVDSAAAVSMTTAGERHRSYSSSDSEHQVCGTDGGHQHLRPVPAPRPSKLYNGGGGTAADVVVRRKKRDDQQQPELLKVFARRSLKLGKDGEPEFLLLAADVDRGDDGDGGDNKATTPSNGEWPVEQQQQQVPSEDRVVVVLVDNDNRHAEHVVVDVNENQTVAAATAAVEVVPKYKCIQQRREEWEKLLLQQQRN
ncbi:uncharacterized protein LOC132930244 [Rhopalosiphum padi]|uniref:uncharacterized protein LOC132930244 n=1 Tax=Rhopalosiphum padi TaxID=40932 RepID=UPI00298E3C59|nr:uncharacterized protein LOC132930244 [Rhopalosiphum padi]XP_060851985.1 uncharacterized protein LOC132930244 [Rhopalosiphum padi]